MKTTNNIPDQSSQRGWVLMIGLMVLVMLTIIAMALMRTTLLEEKMAGASRDINLSFEAAEIALRGAETFIESQSDESAFATTNAGLYAQGTSLDDIEPAPFDTNTDWDDDDSRVLASALAGVTSAPRYMIKKVGESGGEGSLNIGGYGETDLTQKSVIYRITARGTGGNDNTQTVLRSHYARAY
jgi:type IV pilus assembly protein PilX